MDLKSEESVTEKGLRVKKEKIKKSIVFFLERDTILV